MMGLLLVAALAAVSAIMIVARRRGVALLPPMSRRHPESLTADLSPESEEYLAWLAAHHWPDDEYLELERRWRTAGDDEPPAAPPMCPRCGRVDDDVWPCGTCGRLLHSSCGCGMTRRRVAKPYRTRDMSSETVVAEWTCTGCSAVVGLDVEGGAGSRDSDQGDEESGRSRT